jgi:hypothetical protein
MIKKCMCLQRHTQGWFSPDWLYRQHKFKTISFTKVVSLAMQVLDRKAREEPVLRLEEETIDYEA